MRGQGVAAAGLLLGPAPPQQLGHTYDERRPDPAPPPRTEISGNDQSFVETGDDAYRLSFVWKDTTAPCWSNQEYQVQHRTFVGRWHGTPAAPYDGDVRTTA